MLNATIKTSVSVLHQQDKFALQVSRIAEHIDSQEWPGLQLDTNLPGRGRGIKATKPFVVNEVLCDYSGELLSDKEGRKKYQNTPEGSMGYMFEFRHRGMRFWRDATTEKPGLGRLINHSRCHANVSLSLIHI